MDMEGGPIMAGPPGGPIMPGGTIIPGMPIIPIIIAASCAEHTSSLQTTDPQPSEKLARSILAGRLLPGRSGPHFRGGPSHDDRIMMAHKAEPSSKLDVLRTCQNGTHGIGHTGDRTMIAATHE
jgi:hypothetical protein